MSRVALLLPLIAAASAAPETRWVGKASDFSSREGEEGGYLDQVWGRSTLRFSWKNVVKVEFNKTPNTKNTLFLCLTFGVIFKNLQNCPFEHYILVLHTSSKEQYSQVLL